MDMTIFVEPEFRRKNLSRQMMHEMLNHLREEEAYSPSEFIYIDTDASEEYWDHVGLTPNPNMEDASLPEYGYEKRISMDALRHFALQR